MHASDGDLGEVAGLLWTRRWMRESTPENSANFKSRLLAVHYYDRRLDCVEQRPENVTTPLAARSMSAARIGAAPA